MTDAVVRKYLAILRRQWWVVLQAAVIVGLVAGLLAARDSGTEYQASAQLYVEPAVAPDGTLPALPEEQIATPQSSMPAVLVARLTREASGPRVREAASEALGGTPPVRDVGVRVDPVGRTVTIDARAESADDAIAVANAVAQAVVDVRWQDRKEVLEAALAEANAELSELSAGTSTTPLAAQPEDSTRWSERQGFLEGELKEQNGGAEFLLSAEGARESSGADPLTRALQGAAIGLILGIGIAALREVLDSRVRDREQAEEFSGLETVAELPVQRSLRDRRLAVLDAPESQFAEGIRALRASLMWRDADSAPRSIAVTSPEPGDGTSTVAANLAAAFALAGVSTILVSADLRDPEPGTDLLIPRTEPDPSGRGLAELIADDRHTGHHAETEIVEGALIPTRLPKLRWLPTCAPGRVRVSGSAELLSSAQARKVFVGLAGLAEVVVVDAPPTVRSDAAILTGLVDGVLLVVRLGTTQRNALRRTKRVWRGAEVTSFGMVVNSSRPMRKRAIGTARKNATRPSSHKRKRRATARPAPAEGATRHDVQIATKAATTTRVSRRQSRAEAKAARKQAKAEQAKANEAAKLAAEKAAKEEALAAETARREAKQAELDAKRAEQAARASAKVAGRSVKATARSDRKEQKAAAKAAKVENRAAAKAARISERAAAKAAKITGKPAPDPGATANDAPTTGSVAPPAESDAPGAD